MATFMMLTRLYHGALKDLEGLEKLKRQVADRIGTECPEVEWTGSYATLRPCDYLGIFEAPDIESATKVATVIRTFGHAHTETWAAIEWKRFKEIAGSLLPYEEG